MGVEYLTPEYEVLRNENRCTRCGALAWARPCA